MRNARTKLGLTQQDLSEMVGCSESKIARVETGRYAAEEELKAKISEILKIHTWEVGR